MKTTLSLALLLIMILTTGAKAATYQTVIHCNKAGTLELPADAYYSQRLKVTGVINAVDFRTLKAATVRATTELDLSEADIEAYTGTDGCYIELIPDMFVGDPEVVNYPADYLPVDCFSIEVDNSLHKWREPSNSLRHIILPSSLKGIMRRTLNELQNLKSISISDSKSLKVKDGVALFTADDSKLLSLLPSFHGHLAMPDGVTSIADEALKNASPASLNFTSRTEISLGEGNDSFECTYITSPIPEYFATLFDGADCFQKTETINLHCEGNDLIDQVANLGLNRSELRNMTVSGYLTLDELDWLMQLPNLHYLNLENTNDLQLSNITSESLTDFVFPTRVADGQYLTINAPNLQGEVYVSEGTGFIQCRSSVLSRVTLPASLNDFCRTDNFYRQPVEYLDMSRCRDVTSIESLDECPFLETLLLPPCLHTLENVKSPLQQLELPSSVVKIRDCNKWEVEELILPEKIEEFEMYRAPRLKRMDVSACHVLSKFSALSHAPLLEELDLRGTAIKELELFSANTHMHDNSGISARPPQSRIVVTGSVHVADVCGIKNLYLPSSLTELTGINYCDALEELDLSGCEQISTIGTGNNCNRLHTVKFPHSVTTVSGLNECPALRNITLGAETPPAVSSNLLDESMPDITVTVPAGKRNIYMLAETWEKAKSITEGGYNVKIAPSYSSGVTYIVTGAGLYESGATVKVSAQTIPGDNNNMLTPKGWYIDDIYTEGADTSFTMPEHNVTCSVVFDEKMSDPDLQISLYAPDDTEITAWNDLDSYHQFESGDAYLDGVKVSVGGPDHHGAGKWQLTAGEHTLKVYGCKGELSLGKNRETFQPEGGFEVRDVVITEECQVRNLYFGCVNMDQLVLPHDSDMRYLAVGSGHLSHIDVSGANRLEGIAVENCGLLSLQLGDKPELWQVNLWGNRLTSLDLSGCPAIESLSCENNMLETDTLDDEGCVDLSTLPGHGFDIARIITISKPLRGTKILFGNQDGSVDNTPVTYTYDAGRGYELPFKIQCTAKSWSDVDEILIDSAHIITDGCNIIADGLDDLLEVYTIDGLFVSSLTSDGVITVDRPGVYILRCNSFASKILIK